jgi:SpoVK/Ycf46/Vps4 family AAA+-type ATPase
VRDELHPRARPRRSCATGRFDYVIPIGAPDAAARRDLAALHPGGVSSASTSDALVEASDLFTPADIEFAARKGSQRALESAVYGDGEDSRSPAARRRPTTSPRSETRPTLTTAIVDEFTEDIATIARL